MHIHKNTHTNTQSQLCQFSSRTHLDVSPGHREQVVGLRHGAELCWASGAPQQKPYMLLSEWIPKAELSPTTWSSKCHWTPTLQRLATVKTPQLNLRRGDDADPYISGQMHLLILPLAVFQDRKPLAMVMESPCMQSIFSPFPWCLLPRSVSLNLIRLLPPSKCYPLTCREGIQPSQIQTEQAREEGQALRQTEKGKKERRGGGSALAVESPVAERLMESLSLFASHPLWTLSHAQHCRKREFGESPPHLSLSF